MSEVRLIERWLPIAALSEESVRERRAASSLPPINYLHVWWARRPLIASRAAVLASLLPPETTEEEFLSLLGILGDPVAARRKIDAAKRHGIQIEGSPYGYPRAFESAPKPEAITRLMKGVRPVVVDPTAGGGSIPLEAHRLGFKVYANDINPVASLILTASLDYVSRHGFGLIEEFKALADEFLRACKTKLDKHFPARHDERVDGYLWARTINCPYCSGQIPLSPNWRLGPGGKVIKLNPKIGDGPNTEGRFCCFEIVDDNKLESPGTISIGDATCPYPDCLRVISGDEVKKQAQAGGFGEQLFAVAAKRAVQKQTKTGRVRNAWERLYRAPTEAEQDLGIAQHALYEASANWEITDLIPNEEIWSNRRGSRVNDPSLYGAERWTDLFSPRQLLVHGTCMEVFRELIEKDGDNISGIRRASYVLLSFSLDKYRDYNSRMTRWHSKREVIVNTFDRHDFAVKWSYAEMAPVGAGGGLKWVLDSTLDSVKGILKLSDPKALIDGNTIFRSEGFSLDRQVEVSCKSADDIGHIDSASVDAVIIDPPYGANVMYSELSDFFYVWLKRSAGLVVPELFQRRLTDKDLEAVANKAKFAGMKGSQALADREYQERMSSIFLECRRILKTDGIMTVMFTHKDSGAWDALTTGLIQAGFMITASWPVNTEAEGSLHIKDKAAANSTIFLVCRPRNYAAREGVSYWEDIEPQVAKAVRQRVEDFQRSGISGVDLYLASFGPALEEFSKHWPLQRGAPRPEPASRRKRKQAEMFEEAFDPYAVTPEDALEAARREVKTWRLNQLMHMRGKEDLDPVTSWFVLAWDAFKAPVFAYDEGLRLARAVGVDLDSLIGRLCEKKGSDVKLWDSSARAAKGALGPADGSRGLIDVIHHVAHLSRSRTVEDARELLTRNKLDSDPSFLNALEAVLEVLPPSKGFLGFDVATGDAKSAADDFDALERLRRVAFADAIDQPKQLELFAQEAAMVEAEVAAA